MSRFFGVDFFRIVNEGLVDDWAQVYAKVPFEEEELISKGSLFGVLRIKGGKKLVSKGSDIFLWLDEYFNKTEEKGDLRGLVEGLLKVSSELEAAWVWVMIDSRTGDRVAKSVAMNGGKVIIVRDGRQMVLSNGDERVVTGGLKAGDRLGLGVGGMVDRLQGLGDKGLEKAVADLNEQVEKETEQAVAGLLLEVRPVSVKASATPGEPMLVTPGETSDEEPLVAERIVTDRMVGGKKWMRWLRRPKGRLNIGSGTEKNGKVLWLGVVFLILLVVSVVGGVIRGKKEKIETSWQSEVGSWQKREDEAKSLVQVNPMGARKLLREVQTEVKNAENVWVGTKYEEEWTEYKLKLDESWTEVSGEKQVEPKLFLGLSLIRSELKGSRIVGLGEDVGVLDLELGLMVKINLEDKKAEMLASDKTKKWKAVGGDDKREVFLMESGLSLSGGEEVGFDAAVADPVEIEVFGGGIYVLDAGAGEVWKFNLVGGEIQDRRRWLNPEQEIGMGELVDLSIDGDIWVLGKKGEVSKLRRGSRERFALEGKPENLVGGRLAVQLDGEKLAILDNAGSRIVIFDKESGEYLHQLMWEGFSKTKDLLYTADGRLLVLSEGKLLWVE